MKTVQKLSGLSIEITLSLLAAALLSLLVSFSVQAEQSKVFGNYTVHYSVFTTDNLTPSVAKQYNIPRSKKRALLNVSVLKKTSDGSSKPSKAIIKGTTTNLNKGRRQLTRYHSRNSFTSISRD